MIESNDATLSTDVIGLEFGQAQRLVSALLDTGPGAAGEGIDPDLPRIGDYLIDREIGRGGGGTVYHAVLPGWNDEFAIKVLHLPVGDSRMTRRAWRELDLVEELDLPDTPRVFEYGLHEGRMFIVSEHVDGRRLDHFCHDLDRRQRVALLIRIARRVHALHDRGIIHRDLKPSNILVNAKGDPVIIDLGIATLVSDDLTESLSLAGAPIGTVAYMSPEQARGQRSGTILGDVYGLGATACEILTGERPHDLHDATVLEAINVVGHAPARSVGDLDPHMPARLAWIIDKALAATPRDRFESAAELADELQNWLDGMPLRTQPSSWWRNRWLSVKRQPGRWAVGTAACIGFLGMAVFSGVSSVRAAEHAAQADARQEWFLKYQQAIGNASARFSAALADGGYVDARNMLTLLESHVLAAEGFDPDAAELLAIVEDHRQAFTVDVLEAIHTRTGEPVTNLDLAMSAVRSVYALDPRWSGDADAELENLFVGLGLGDGG